MRQIVQALIESNFEGFDTGSGPKVTVTTLTNYDKTFDVPIAFEPTSMVRILAEVLSSNGLDMLKTAETEKYPHVTYFFNGGVEAPLPCEHRVLIPSPKVATYDLQPEMSAEGHRALVKGISSGERFHSLQLYKRGHGRHGGSSGHDQAVKQSFNRWRGLAAERGDERSCCRPWQRQDAIDPATGVHPRTLRIGSVRGG
jgi:hypothetical protein